MYQFIRPLTFASLDLRENNKELLSWLAKRAKEFSMPEPHPIEAIKFMMEQRGINDKDLGVIIKSRSRVSEVLNLKRPLSLEMIKKIHKHLKIPADILIRDYELSV
ncbi:putative transcription regulator containing HTH domain [Aequorivita sublithincola DSM 14238]|uniref:Putative transcription regulator containing HTH domain n=1 Tax=Aequorivita sublithincola (strain DSM 14238 / LMG 21431 / ACAM 643 / 9-3) TaxID=746697 RepID=I3YTQ8_AEQSU|nr:putative transcription regulator containing HTH domain [Aequorivita sublithincola DSM 14238]